MIRKERIRYRRNPRPRPSRESGFKTRDQRCGFLTYSSRLVRDEAGLMVDPRFGTYDVKKDA